MLPDTIAFIIELDKLKTVCRKNKPIGLTRYENSAEHSWQIAMLALACQPYALTAIDINRVIKMLLVHDIGEIDTGDTMIYADIDWEAEKAKERRAVQRIFGLLKQPALEAELSALWQEFEAGESDDARFANALDRAMPPLLNLHYDGQSWRENGTRYSQVVKRLQPAISRGCPPLWDYLAAELQQRNEAGWFGMGRETL